MRKLVFFVLALSLTFHAFCAETAVEIKYDDVDLSLENIHLEDVEFWDGYSIIIESEDLEDLHIDNSTYKLSIIADKKDTKISLQLPVTKRYRYYHEDGICTFDNETLNFDGEDVFVVISEEGIRVKDYDDGSEIIIENENIYIRDSDDTVNINEDGVYIEDGDDEIHLYGIFGMLAGVLARSIVNTTLNVVGRTPDKTFKFIVNEQDEEQKSYFSWN